MIVFDNYVSEKEMEVSIHLYYSFLNGWIFNAKDVLESTLKKKSNSHFNKLYTGKMKSKLNSIYIHAIYLKGLYC